MTYRSSTYPARFLECAKMPKYKGKHGGKKGSNIAEKEMTLFIPIVIADSLKEVTNDKKTKFITLTYY